MTVLNFPASPSNGDTYEENGVIYTWNGSYWSANNATDLSSIYVAIAGDRMTGHLELPGGGGDTAALQKQEIELLIDESGGGGSGPTDLYWERDAGALSPKVSTDNVVIGDDKITLNADGSATLGVATDLGNLPCHQLLTGAGGGTNRVLGAVGGGAAFVSDYVSGGTGHHFIGTYAGTGNFNYLVDHLGSVKIGGTLPSTPNISLNADGTSGFGIAAYSGAAVQAAIQNSGRRAFHAANPDSNGGYFYFATDAGGNTRFMVSDNGDCKNTSGNFTSISDIKLKRDVTEADSQWSDIKDLRVVNYYFKDPALPQHKHLGFIAQEVEKISPQLVDSTLDFGEDNEPTGTETKGVKLSVIFIKAIKALQEAQIRIETLEAKVQSLEGGN